MRIATIGHHLVCLESGDWFLNLDMRFVMLGCVRAYRNGAMLEDDEGADA